MYNWERSKREEKLRKHPRNPSFSSTLLDEIYRSIDDDNCEEPKFYREKSTKRHSIHGVGGVQANTGSIEDEEMASLRRACLIEKWMERKVHEKVSSLRSKQDNDPLFFSSSSISSDSSLESFNTSNSRKTSFSVPRPKQIKTNISCYDYDLFDDYHDNQQKHEESLVKSKLRALKIYNNLKSAKQPVSPGRRLTRFLNSLFSNTITTKKTKNISSSTEGYQDQNVNRKSNSTQHKSVNSTCSSASSFSRSCLSKNSKDSNNGVKRTVRFYPVSVIVDEDCRPCGHKCIDGEDLENFRRSDHVNDRKSYHYQSDKKQNKHVVITNLENDEYEDEDEDEDDAGSDSSSDLFELDHLELIGNDRYCEELPVYETTCIDSNRAIANGLIR
ncbi:protein BIG GRAIN 1-like A [Cornus florida]|uniref:protein BIG GRAIN 1-like A n=1 Tax=Cornus florida TaxID=4283 RepID=UPI00289FD07C|nr:protein BIG GRAIN 1-like A [Cornus florida]